MSLTLSYNRFEELVGDPLARYSIEVFKQGIVPTDFIDYFKANAARWDGLHLEFALGFLWRLDTNSARHLIADHLEHPLHHIRCTAYGMVDNMVQVDDYIMTRIGAFAQSPARVREFFGAEEVGRFRDQAVKRHSCMIQPQ
jgi:hypothetical protein